MPQVWPDDIVPNACEFFLQHNTTVFESPITRTRQRLRRPGERWMCTASFRLVREKAQRLDALLAKLAGSYDTVTLGDWARINPSGDNLDKTGIPNTFFSDGTDFTDNTEFAVPDEVARLRFAAVRGASSLRAKGWMPNTAPLDAGDYIGVGGWIYMLTDDASSDGNGFSTLNIAPRVRADTAADTLIVRHRPKSPMVLIDDDQPNRSIQVGTVYHYTLSFAEALV